MFYNQYNKIDRISTESARDGCVKYVGPVLEHVVSSALKTSSVDYVPYCMTTIGHAFFFWQLAVISVWSLDSVALDVTCLFIAPRRVLSGLWTSPHILYAGKIIAFIFSVFKF